MILLFVFPHVARNDRHISTDQPLVEIGFYELFAQAALEP
jgi:hypothetical protein